MSDRSTRRGLAGSITQGASHGTSSMHDDHSRTLEQRKARRSESAVQAQRDLGDPGSLAAIDSNLRACDLVKLRVRDVCHGGDMASRAIVLQQKTQRPVQFKITEPTRGTVGAWIGHAELT